MEDDKIDVNIGLD